MEVWLIIIILYILYKVLDRLVRWPLLGNRSSKYILITGCDTGFGNLATKELDKLGCHVFAGCLTETGETDLRKSTSSRVKTFHLDVTNHDSVLKALEFVKKELPAGRGLWGIMNNAGINNTLGPVEFPHMADYKSIINVNTLGTVDVTTTFLHLVKKERGRVVNMSSMCGLFSIPGGTPYSISKYGVEAYSDNLRRELRAWGVKVCIVEAGFFNTNISNKENLRAIFWKTFNGASRELQEEYGREYATQAEAHQIDKQLTRVTSDRVHHVVNAYIHGLIGRYPRARYLLGVDARILLFINSLPEWIGDAIFHFSQGGMVPQCCKK